MELVIYGEALPQSERRKIVLELERSTQTLASARTRTDFKRKQNVVTEQTACYVAQSSICPCHGRSYKIKKNRHLACRTFVVAPIS
jgi:hypothetical protein